MELAKVLTDYFLPLITYQRENSYIDAQLVVPLWFFRQKDLANKKTLENLNQLLQENIQHDKVVLLLT